MIVEVLVGRDKRSQNALDRQAAKVRCERGSAEASGVPRYDRVPTVGTDPRFIAALAALVEAAT